MTRAPTGCRKTTRTRASPSSSLFSLSLFLFLCLSLSRPEADIFPVHSSSRRSFSRFVIESPRRDYKDYVGTRASPDLWHCLFSYLNPKLKSHRARRECSLAIKRKIRIYYLLVELYLRTTIYFRRRKVFFLLCL